MDATEATGTLTKKLQTACILTNVDVLSRPCWNGRPASLAAGFVPSQSKKSRPDSPTASSFLRPSLISWRRLRTCCSTHWEEGPRTRRVHSLSVIGTQLLHKRSW